MIDNFGAVQETQTLDVVLRRIAITVDESTRGRQRWCFRDVLFGETAAEHRVDVNLFVCAYGIAFAEFLPEDFRDESL